jgi:putative DNA primase/helicase
MHNPNRADDTLGSFKFNLSTGAWADFAVEAAKGHGLVSIYCYLYGVNTSTAIQQLKLLVNLDKKVPQKVKVKVNAEKPVVTPVNAEDVQLPPDVHPQLGFPSKVFPYYLDDGKVSFYIYRFQTDEGKKEIRPLTWSPQKCQWVWQHAPKPSCMYNLPDLKARSAEVVVVCEGEKAADAAAKMFPGCVVTTSVGGSDQAHATDWSPMSDRDVIIVPDKDGPGRNYAIAVAAEAYVQGASIVRVVDVFHLDNWQDGDDLADHTVGPDFLDAAVEVGKLFKPKDVEAHYVEAAAKLKDGDFDRIKKQLSDRLGISARTFQSLVKAFRLKGKAMAESESEGFKFPNEAIEPWDDPVDGEELFAEITALIKRHVVLSEAQVTAVACWIVFTYGYDSMTLCPQLLVSSPSKRCGKTTLLEAIMLLLLRPLAASNITPSAVFRSVEACKPTLVIDEADTFLNGRGSDEMAGILNSGHRRATAFVIRTEEIGGKRLPVQFSTFCTKIIAMIKAPTDTILDRSIPIRLERRLSVQPVEPITVDAAEKATDTRRHILRWIKDNAGIVEYNENAIPITGNDRARQNWAVLAAFAKVLGPKAFEALTTAAIELADTADLEDNSEMDLLSDLRQIVSTSKSVVIQSALLVKALVKMAHRPWAEISSGRPLTENKLARMLRPYNLQPSKHPDGVVWTRGYLITDLHRVFDRYLPKSLGDQT